MGWATIVPRGCGDRKEDGIYAECGLGPGGRPLEDFLIDSPLPLPDGLDARGLANKAQVWMDPRTGLHHLVIWIGAEHYPYVADYVEEVRRYGASRRISSAVDLSKLTPGKSRMILVHPLARVVNWPDMAKPRECAKRIVGHAGPAERVPTLALEDGRTVEADPAPCEHPTADRLRAPMWNVNRQELCSKCGAVVFPAPAESWESKAERVAAMSTEDLMSLAARDMAGESVTLTPPPPLYAATPEAVARVQALDAGPCLFKTWELIPAKAGEEVGDGLYMRTIASTTYTYEPTGEDAAARFEPGIFAALPLHGLALIRRRDGTTDEKRAAKLDKSGMPWYAADK